MLTKVYQNALTEVFEIINCLNDTDYNKIPQEVIQGIKANINEEYEYYLDETLPFEQQNMLPETRTILFNLYRDYLSEKGQKEKILEYQRKERFILEQEKREKYSPENLFKKEDIKEETNIEMQKNTVNTLSTIQKESFFIRFKNFIFKILHINK